MNNKYQGTMYAHMDSVLTDRMLAADALIERLEYLHDNADGSIIASALKSLNDIESEILDSCSESQITLPQAQNDGGAKCLLKTIIYQTKTIFHEIYVSWISGNQGYTPCYEECVNYMTKRINEEDAFRNVLNGMRVKNRGHL
ncbi:MAG: hypothetical protein MJZ41_09255 [Bacteroidaceae bacterium]|nr:hypothetical protein [Bacteroidaceae bacterium]